MGVFKFGVPLLGSLALLLASAGVHAADADLRVSSLGFRPTDLKRVSSVLPATSFQVRRTADDQPVLEGLAADEPPKTEGGYPVPTTILDFSELNEPGSYYVVVEGVGRTIDFTIGANVYDDTVMLGLLGLYGWRANQDVKLEHQGTVFAHVKGHMNDGYLDQVGAPGESKDGLGGWYDAGDYGKYTVNGAFSVGCLLSAWEQFSETLSSLDLPVYPKEETLPQFLQELKFQLTWLLKMQILDGELAGATYHKLTPLRFAEMILPQDDNGERFFAPHGSTSTAAFAAATAQGARVFADVDPMFSAELLAAAELAWLWLSAHPAYLEADISAFSTGTYQSEDHDERFWAAVELWVTTGHGEYLEMAEQSMPSEAVARSFDWDQMANLGFYSYLRTTRDGRNAELVEQAEEDLVRAADGAVGAANNSPWGRADSRYDWGANGRTARQCMTLMVARELTGRQEYEDACGEQLGYLYGRNPYNRSQITGHGIDPPLQPHHRISVADDVELPYPGLLVGGGTAPANWQDRSDDFQTNEVAINWNAALIYAAAGLARGELVYDPKAGGSAPTLEGPPPAPAPPVVDLIDDLEDGDLFVLRRGVRNGAWYAVSDETGSAPALELTDDAGRGRRAISATGTGYTRWGAGLGFTFVQADGLPQSFNARGMSGLRFLIKTASKEPKRVRVVFRDAFTDATKPNCTVCDDHFKLVIEATNEWTEQYVPFSRLGQAGYGDKEPGLSVNYLLGVEFRTFAGDALDLSVDQVGFASTDPAHLGEGLGGEGPLNSGELGGSDAGAGGAGGAGGEAGNSSQPPAREQKGGCGCHTVGRAPGDFGVWGTMLFGSALALRRRGGRRRMETTPRGAREASGS